MSDHPVLLFIVGPPAVGKMTVGHEVARRTGFALFHNHLMIEPLLEIFPFGSPPFGLLVTEFRRRVLEEAVNSPLPGLVFTYVWAFDDPEDEQVVNSFAEIYRRAGGRVVFAELQASQEERLRRNETPFRLERKPSKRDLAASRARLLENDRRYRLDSGGRFTGSDHYLVIDNTALAPDEVATRIIQRFRLPPVAPLHQGE